MPDEQGNHAAESETATPLHAYGDGREAQAEEGSRGITGDQGAGDPGSYQEGGHEGETQSGAQQVSAGDHDDAPGAHAGAGSGKMDPDRAGTVTPSLLSG